MSFFLVGGRECWGEQSPEKCAALLFVLKTGWDPLPLFMSERLSGGRSGPGGGRASVLLSRLLEVRRRRKKVICQAGLPPSLPPPRRQKTKNFERKGEGRESSVTVKKRSQQRLLSRSPLARKEKQQHLFSFLGFRVPGIGLFFISCMY